MQILDYDLVDTAAETRSPSFPDYTRLVAFSDIVLSLLGSASVAFGLTNLVYNIYYHRKRVLGFVLGFLGGLILSTLAIYLSQLVASTCRPGVGVIPGLNAHSALLWCGAVSPDKALSMVGILHNVVWGDLCFGLSLCIGSLVLIVVNFSSSANSRNRAMDKLK